MSNANCLLQTFLVHEYSFVFSLRTLAGPYRFNFLHFVIIKCLLILTILF
jgi:hypothetical protein